MIRRTSVMRCYFASAFCFVLLSVLGHDSMIVAADSEHLDDRHVGGRVAEMFQSGFGRGPQAFKDVQRKYDSLRPEAAQDGRIDFAHGLVLMKLLRNKESQAEFLSATKRPGPIYWPAWQGLIWSNFVAKDLDAGYDSLLDFARLVKQSDELRDLSRSDYARWTGKVMGGLEMTIEGAPAREVWLQADEKLRQRLGEELTSHYYGGKEEVYIQHSLIEDEIRLAREKAKEKQAVEIDKQNERIAKTVESANERKENLKKSAAATKDAFDEQTSAFQKQIARLEKDYTFLEKYASTILTSISTIDLEINLLRQQARTQPFISSGIIGAPLVPVERVLIQLTSQRGSYDSELQRTAAAARQISMKAQSLSEQRANLVQDYQNITGELIREDAGLNKWKERANQQSEALKKAEATGRTKAPVAASKIQQARSFRTYIDLDLATERDKVLESYGIVSVGK